MICIIWFVWLLFGFKISCKSEETELIISVKNCIIQILLQKAARNSSTIFRSSHQRCSIKKAFLRHFMMFIGKHLCWGLFFNKVAGYQCCSFIKKRLQHLCFLVNIEKFKITPILKKICEWLYFWKVFCKNIFQIRT